MPLMQKLVLLAASVHLLEARNSLSRTPPMGWMSWVAFGCNTDCSTDAGSCISEWLYRNQTDALVEGGYAQAGYTGIHIDDCWMQKAPGQGAQAHGHLVGDKVRFPSGMKALGDYIHKRGAKFGLYTAESPTTCADYPASAGHEAEDAATFAVWGVDYMKVDGCGDPGYYEYGYRAMGAALEASGRSMVYSCSWPAYIGDNESTKPFSEFIMDGCNLWRNWADIACNWGSLSSIIDHWGDYGSDMAPFAGPGHWHDMDMLLVGGNCITLEEERTQMAIWAISASPLIMGNDLRRVSDASRAALLSPGVIAVSQDALGQMGLRLPGFSSKSPQQVWARNLANGDVAVALYNKLGVTVPEVGPGCPSWHEIQGGRLEACSGGAGDFLWRRGFGAEAIANLTLAEARLACCADVACEGFVFSAHGRKAAYQDAAASDCEGLRLAAGRKGEGRGTAVGAADIEIRFADVNLHGAVSVLDIWTGKALGTLMGSYTARAVPLHGAAFLRLSPAAPSLVPGVGAIS